MHALPDKGHVWDALIIGAGMGGSFAARSLAEAGYNVLLIDSGLKQPPPLAAGEAPTDTLVKCKWPKPIACEIDGKRSRHFGIFGTGIGGSTNIYAAALERFERRDLESHPQYPHPTGGWAIKYDELLPYYRQAESMLHVIGTRDPLSPDPTDHLQHPPPLGRVHAQFMQAFRDRGLHPYRLHVGMRYVPGCDECPDRICYRNCRSDGRSVIAEGRVQPTIMDRTQAVRLEASRDSVSTVILQQGERTFSVGAKIFVLAAGAAHTPKLLLESHGENWPDGLANSSGMVGRNLMFHAGIRFILWPLKKFPSAVPRKSISLRDFSYFQGQRLGVTQSMGIEAGYGDLLMHLYQVFDRSSFRKLRILRPFLRIPAALGIQGWGKGAFFACILEDLPYPDNRVVLDKEEEDGILMTYTVRQELRDRRQALEDALKKRLKGLRLAFLTRDVELNLGHACGTCVMGQDPATTVVDRHCQAHGIDNLFITDASFMPTSAAINPSLTVAANALRVADRIKYLLARERKAQ